MKSRHRTRRVGKQPKYSGNQRKKIERRRRRRDERHNGLKKLLKETRPLFALSRIGVAISTCRFRDLHITEHGPCIVKTSDCGDPYIVGQISWDKLDSRDLDWLLVATEWEPFAKKGPLELLAEVAE